MKPSLHTPLTYAVLGLALGSVWLHACATAGADDGARDGGGIRERAIHGELLDCREVDCFQRAACNRRVLAALGQIKTTTSEVRGYQSPSTTERYIAVQLERQARLRSFVAPECRPPTSMCDRLPILATACRAVGRFLEEGAARTKPATGPDWARTSLPERAKIDLSHPEQRYWLSGQWDGWLVYDDHRAVQIWVRFTGMPTFSGLSGMSWPYTDGFVNACSDQGMVLGLVEDGMLKLPRPEPLAFGSRMLLWRSAPYYDDLEGVVLFEIEPGRELQNGQVWLSRALTPAPAREYFNPTDYPCQGKEVLDRRKGIWFPNPLDPMNP